LKRAAERLTSDHHPDEASFYGPKNRHETGDAIVRLWQLSTIQFDFTLPRRFELDLYL